MKDTTYNGYTNSATYLVALYCDNEVKIYNEIVAIKKKRTITTQDVKKCFQRNKLVIDSWAKGKINWKEIADNYNNELEA